MISKLILKYLGMFDQFLSHGFHFTLIEQEFLNIILFYRFRGLVYCFIPI